MTVPATTAGPPTAALGRRVRWLAPVMILVLGGLLGLAATTAPNPALAADLSTWQAGNIISDSVLFDGTAMTVPQIDAFLQAKGSNCVSHTLSTCLKDYRQFTGSKPADAYCGAYTGGPSETAAEIIVKVSAACQVNPQAILVMLQKEQSLVTRSFTPPSVYDKALGFACPDFQPCDPAFAGFFAQIYSAARQLQRYVAPGSTFRYQAGRVNQIQYSPDASCGSSPVFIENRATAALYNYTPYQPNAAALAAGYGTGDTCSAYGNRNFYQYFTDWFGNPRTQTAPIGAVDTLTAAVGTVTVAGWALDRDIAVPLTVHVYVDGVAKVAAVTDQARPDVGAAYGVTHTTGYRVVVPATTGSHEVCVYALDGNRGPLNPRLGCRTVDVPANTAPMAHLDTVTAGLGTITVAGWAFDVDADPAPTNIHVYVDGRAVRNVAATGRRSDVAAAFGVGRDHGFNVTIPAETGPREVCVYAINQPTGPHPLVGCRTVEVDAAPVGYLDSVVPGDGTVTVTGWVFDANLDPAPTTVHVYVDGIATRAVVANAPRPDVGRIHGVGSEHGFQVTIPVAAGDREVCVYAINWPIAPHPRFGCRSVTVTTTVIPPGPPPGTPGDGNGTTGGAGGPSPEPTTPDTSDAPTDPSPADEPTVVPDPSPGGEPG